MVRFLHTSDWQLGMTRHFFSEGAQEHYNQARFDVIRTLGRIAEAEKCQFIAVCGDAFESNQVERKTVARTSNPPAATCLYRSQLWLIRAFTILEIT